MTNEPLAVSAELLGTLGEFFPRVLSGREPFSYCQDQKLVLDILESIDSEPIQRTRFNQALHLLHEAGVSEGFFQYYFIRRPPDHPYSISRILGYTHVTEGSAIHSLSQLAFGIRRFYIDALLFFGDLRTAYRELRSLNYEDLCHFYHGRRQDTQRLMDRGKPLPVMPVPVDDRHLISEIAYQACTAPGGAVEVPLIRLLRSAYRRGGGGRTTIKQLFNASDNGTLDPNEQLILEFMSSEDGTDVSVESDEEIPAHVQPILQRYSRAREVAIENTRRYLSIVNELDVYVATSMRTRDDFRKMARDCDFIFAHPALRGLNIRYFDPTLSAATNHQDKGLIECLMVKCAKVLLYFAGDRDTYGKDAEVAMALSLGKPAIILCPDDARGGVRARVFKDVHPLTRLIEFETGVAVGGIVTQSANEAATLLSRFFRNEMEYDLEHKGDGYFRLCERLTQSVVRLQTNDRLLRESFWNYYHSTP